MTNQEFEFGFSSPDWEQLRRDSEKAQRDLRWALRLAVLALALNLIAIAGWIYRLVTQ